MLRSFIRRLFRARRPSRRWLTEAAALQQAGRYREAVALCQEQLARDDRDVDALQSLAAALLAQGHTTEGLAALDKAAALAPGNAQVFETLGRVRAALGRVDAA